MRAVGRILSIELTSRGFAFAVLEDDEGLIDWGSRQVRGDVSLFLSRLMPVVERYRPQVLVLEEPAGSRRGVRAREWLAWAEDLAVEKGLRCWPMPRGVLLDDSGPQRLSRWAVAERVAQGFPQLRPLLPPRPRLWQTEPAFLSVFIAIARALALLAGSERAA